MALKLAFRRVAFNNYRQLVVVGSQSSGLEAELETPEKSPALANASRAELIRAIFVLRFCSWSLLAKNAEQLYRAGLKVLGERAINGIFRSTFHAQFVAGATKESLHSAAQRLLSTGNVKLMLCPPMENLEGSIATFGDTAKRNRGRMLDFLSIADEINQLQSGQRCVVQYKLSAIFPAEATDAASSYDMARGVPLKESARKYLDVMSGSRNVKINPVHNSMAYGLLASKEIFEKAKAMNIPIMLDGELKSSYRAMLAINLASMHLFNPLDSSDTLLYGTFQCYFKDIHSLLEDCYEICRESKVRLGAKLVRGAYMDAERAVALKKGIPDPIWETAEKTSESYDKAVHMSLTRFLKNPGSAAFFIGTHNKASVIKAVNTMAQEGIAPSDPSVTFAQIYGMCDHLSYTLGHRGYNVYKSTPWGEVSEWLPYLARRASENHTAFHSARNEIPIYQKALRQSRRPRVSVIGT